ncbi:MAG: DUF4838 domain-containing protein [Planctomycetota bacterium]
MWTLRTALASLALSFLCLAAPGVEAMEREKPVTVTKLTLVENGRANCAIILAKNPTRAAQFAAYELQWHLKKMTGVEVNIGSEDGKVPGKWTRILVGESHDTQDLGLHSADFKPQEYLIRFAPEQLILMGRDKDDHGKVDYTNGSGIPEVFDEQGTCYAVYDFLERFCAVRWYAPGEIGLVCPERKTLEVSGLEVRRTPFFPYRHGSYAHMYGFIKEIWNNPGGHDIALFFRRLRLGGQPYSANHSFYGYYGRFGKKNEQNAAHFEGEHPEYFAQGYEAQPPQPCFSNEGFIRQVVQDARDYFDGKGLKQGAVAAGDFFALVPMDNGFWCKCAKCQAEMNPPAADAGWASDNASDYFFNFANKVARQVAKTQPGKWLATLAYSSYTGHPRRVALEPNISVQFCMAVRNWWAPANEKADLSLFQEWVEKEKGRPFYLWLYYCFPEEIAMNNKFHCFPGFFAHTIDRQFKLFARDGVKGMFLNNLGDYLDTYVTFKYFDDPSQDIDKLIDEFHTLYYGAAAEPMKKLYLGIEETYMNPKNYPPEVVEGKQGGHQTVEMAWKYLGTAERMAAWGKLMAEAQALAQTGLEKKRVALFEKTFWDYMVEGRKQFVARTTAPIPALKAPRVPDAGGDAGKAAWDKAAALGGENWYERGGDKPAARKFSGRVAHDGRFLYLELVDNCETKKLVNSAKVFPCDDWEIFIARQRAIPYRQYAVSPSGQVVALAHGEVNFRMNVDIEDHGVKAVSDTSAPDKWVTRLAIPLQAAIPGGARPGGKVYINVVRVSSSGVSKVDGFGIDTWVSFCSVHDVDRLAEITLDL